MMTEQTDRRRAADLAKIHIAKKDLAMDDRAYRALLQRVTGKLSAAALSAVERTQVLAAFARIGWQPQPRPDAPPAAAPHGAEAQRRKIAALLKAGGKPPAYGEGIAKRMFNKPLRFCAPAELRAVIAALMRNQQRGAAQAAGHRPTRSRAGIGAQP